MKKLRFILFTLFLAGLSNLVYAAQVNETDALGKAALFYQQKQTSLLRSSPTFKLAYTGKDTLVSLRSADAAVYFYVFNIGNEQGFIIVSGDDATKSILGYSDEGSFSVENMPDNLKHWLDFYQSEIKFSMENKWNTSSLETSSTPTLKSVSTVAPLLGNIEWNQGEPFNILCPFDVTANEHAVTGCVATAMTQIMKYYRWPVTGTGSNSYTSDRYGNLSVDFSKTSYDWDNMFDVYGDFSKTIQDTAVAKLMYHFGVAVNMDYNTAANGGSGAYDNDAALALINYFGYDKDIQTYPRSFYTYTDWKNLIKNELNVSRPIYYSGTSKDGGHAFVCDGYDSNDMFHINWGWGGYYNGYFELTALDPFSEGTGGFVGGFYENQAIIAGIQKEDNTNNAVYQIGTYNKGLSSSQSSLSNISTQTFDINLGFANFGINTFSGTLGVGLYKNGVFVKDLKTSSDQISPNYGYNSYNFKGVSLKNTTAGTDYQIISIYKPTGSTTWFPFKGTTSLNNYLNIVISGNTATIQKPSTMPSLNLTETIQQAGNVYMNKTASFSITVQNTGFEFFSNLGVKIYSATPPLVYQYVDYGVVFISTGETKTLTFSGNITCAPGSYYAVAVYDSTNNFSSTAFRPMGPASFGPIPLTILNDPTSIWNEGKITDFAIYPNPVKELLSIQTSESIKQVQILDTSGRIMQNALNSNSLQVTNLKAGVYFLRVETYSGIRTVKFIKE